MTGSPGGPGTQPQEPVYLNLFEITFVLPTILQAQGRDPVLLLQQAKKVSLGVTNKDIATTEQKFKYSSRMFVNAGPDKSSVDLDIDFNVNVNSQGSMETWNTLRAWYDLVWNSQNGYLHYKADIIGTIIVNQHDKKGVVLRRVTFQNCQMSKLSGYELDWASNNIVENVQADFVYDYFIDEYIDQNFGINPPTVTGYGG
jgi:hypothetical protein